MAVSLKKVIDFLQGKKTYIISVVIGLYELLKAFEVLKVSPEQNAAILAFLGVVFATSLRAAIKKAE